MICNLNVSRDDYETTGRVSFLEFISIVNIQKRRTSVFIYQWIPPIKDLLAQYLLTALVHSQQVAQIGREEGSGIVTGRDQSDDVVLDVLVRVVVGEQCGGDVIGHLQAPISIVRYLKCIIFANNFICIIAFLLNSFHISCIVCIFEADFFWTERRKFYF